MESGKFDLPVISDESMYSEKSKMLLKSALVYVETLCIENNICLSEKPSKIPYEATLIGKEIYEFIINLLHEKKFVYENELIHESECAADPQGADWSSENTENSSISSESSGDVFTEPVTKKTKADFIPLKTKIKIVNLAKQNPTWSVRTLQKRGCSALKRKEYLKRWEEEILKGGSDKEKYNIIDSSTYDRFVEARERCQPVTTKNLREWALAAAAQFPNVLFNASSRWVVKFKKNHNIRLRKITQFTSHKQLFSTDDIMNSAENFRSQCSLIIPDFNADYVINTDQTACQYNNVYNRTLQDSKNMPVDKMDANKTTRSYTVQYSLTLSGKILPKAFICLQESTGDFGARVQKNIDELLKKYKNLEVISSKSGKLSIEMYKIYLEKCLKPYVKDNKFLLFIDSWKGQTNSIQYDEIFQDSSKRPTCTIKVIPSECTQLVQPCDIYFYREVKNFIERIQNCSQVIQENRDLTSREDCLKIHSLIHHQLSAPIFEDMLSFAWFAAGLREDKNIFSNVKVVCFSEISLQSSCECQKAVFICCSLCRKLLCFTCFYDDYHPQYCSN